MAIVEIPYDFIIQHVELGWTEIKFGLDHELVKPKAAIEKATERLCRTDAAPMEVVELASLAENEPVADLVSHLANAETPPAEEHVKAKWLYLVLAWLFEHRESLADPFGMVEKVYSDFDYPKEIVSFVRYMPMDGPDLGNREQNEARLADRWKAYLNRAGKRFARAAGNREYT